MLQDILNQLPKLAPEELEEVRQRLSALAAVDGVVNDEDWLLRGIISLLAERGLEDTVPGRFRITNRRQFHGYLPKSEKVRAVLEPQLESKLDRIVMGQVLARCLADYIENFIEREVTLNSLLQHAELSLPALERSFPGYLRAGLVKVILRGVARAPAIVGASGV